MFGPGKSFPQTFSDTGYYPYYCILHPWMVGAIIVTDGYSTIPNVGKNVGDGSMVFDVEYDFNRIISTATVNEDENSITFEMVGVTNSDDNDLEIILPSELIAGPFVVFVEDEMVEIEQMKDGDINILVIPVDAYSETLTIVGTSVVPEFGTMVMAIMIISVSAMILAGSRFKIQI